ncbi:MAG: hypothetical protein ACREHC_08665 [Candidatus Levyibacteriota bacterium]
MSSLEVRHRTLVLPSERTAVPIAEGETRLQKLYPTRKVTKPEPSSFARPLLLESIGPQVVGVGFQDGKVRPVREESDGDRVIQVVLFDGRPLRLATFDPFLHGEGYNPTDVYREVVAAKVVPVSTWGADGEPADMIINLDPSRQRFSASPPEIRSMHLDQRANTLQALLDRGDEAVFTGRITSPSSWRKEDRGLQTVMLYHDQGHTLPERFTRYGPDGIRWYRQNAAWDKAHHEDEKSASMMISEPVAELARAALEAYWPTGTVREDQFGFSVDLPGYTVDDFRNADPFLVPIFQAFDQRLAYAHGLVYDSALSEVEKFALAEQLRGEGAFDMNEYSGYFNVLAEHDGSPLAETLHALNETGELRQGFGHVFSAGFWKGEGAQFEFSSGVLRGDGDFGLGPNEVRGFKATRVQDRVVPLEQVRQNAVFIRGTV